MAFRSTKSCIDESLGEQEEIDGGGRYSIFAPNVIGNARFSPGGWRASEGGKNGSLLELELAEPNEFSSTVGARIDIVGAEVDYEGPSYVADNTSVFEWDERRGVNIMEGLDESLPIIGVKFEYSWTAETAAARASRAERAAPIKMLDEALATSRPSTE